ncbi:hypothetical protein PTKIN_Ptkin08bG0039800 [Pterospermum kingtungense]
MQREEMVRSYWYKDVLPATAMVAVEFSNVITSVLFKAASSEGISYYIYLTYCFALGTLVLLPMTFFLIRKTGFPPFNFPLITRLCLLALVAFTNQLCVHKGLELGTPTLSSAISNLIPAFTFILAVFIRVEKVALRTSSTRAKILGTIVSVSGASVVVLYKGPKVLFSPQYWTSSSSSVSVLQQHMGSPQSNWVTGGLILAVGYLLYPVWYIILKIFTSTKLELLLLMHGESRPGCGGEIDWTCKKGGPPGCVRWGPSPMLK